MTIVIYLSILNIIVLIFAFISKKILYTVTPEKQWSHALEEFDSNYKSLDKIEIDNFIMSSGHLYENN
ncbi:hypothetical protein [Xanthomarina sp. F2636L]|uniref:hypothetical protein n=1 Tax=Xanthomarina sp. F2636L TaxID=2996018 RepID=UPI00225E3901|nr:hypothetical protein [Xanthomarina sp. F2636L]MCX7549788.1 hypothetical protein [Xanthomarina sp. F2636L]